jgi:hypothetical protein
MALVVLPVRPELIFPVISSHRLADSITNRQIVPEGFHGKTENVINLPPIGLGQLSPRFRRVHY